MCVVELVVKLHAKFLLAAEVSGLVIILQPGGGLMHGELTGQIQQARMPSIAALSILTKAISHSSYYDR